MSGKNTQTFANHIRLVPAYHFVAGLILLYNLGWSLVAAVRHHDAASIDGALVAVALLLLFFYARAFAVAVQDRVIRLEETMRMERLFPADLKARIGEFSAAQFVALRFAPDAELPDLARRALSGELATPTAIKKAIRNWRGDYLRA